ncbi:MAG: AMP-binding protein [Clostridia bacterium]|nr:AMP-binding protein [Clostridia bacterium]
MKLTNIAGHRNIESYVKAKSDLLRQTEANFHQLFLLMFSEKENVFWETNNGYKIIKTTYGEAYHSIRCKAKTLLQRLGTIRHNDIVGLYMQNSLEWIEMFWAILLIGCRPVLLNTRMDHGVLDDLLQKRGSLAVISDGATFSVPTILSSSIEKSEQEIEDMPSGEELFVLSSGTSQSVKMCAYDAKAICEQILNAESILKGSRLMDRHYEGQLKQLVFLPFYHIFGLTAMYMWFGFFSRTFVHLKDMSSMTVLNTIRRHGVTHIFAVPLFWDTVYEQAMKKIKERGEKTFAKFQKGLAISHKLSALPALARFFRKRFLREIRDNLFGESISFMITGGGMIRPEVLSFFNGIGYHLSNGYGMTEIGITSVELSEDNRVLCSGSIGLPMPSVEYQINDEGQLMVRGASLCKYYIEGEETVWMNDGWFATKDLAEQRGGRYYLLGRSDDLIITHTGENINPHMIEDKITHDHIKRVCLVSVEREGQATPVLLVEVNRHIAQSTLLTLRDYVKERLADLHLLSEVKDIGFVGESLMHETEFKLNRKRLACDYALRNLRLLDLSEGEQFTIEHQSELERQVARCFFEALGKEVSLDSDFFLDAGGTSLDYFALVSYIQKEFDVMVPLSNDQKMTTMRQFCTFLKDAM